MAHNVHYVNMSIKLPMKYAVLSMNNQEMCLKHAIVWVDCEVSCHQRLQASGLRKYMPREDHLSLGTVMEYSHWFVTLRKVQPSCMSLLEGAMLLNSRYGCSLRPWFTWFVWAISSIKHADEPTKQLHAQSRHTQLFKMFKKKAMNRTIVTWLETKKSLPSFTLSYTRA